jgi:FixJ family two-component response regulator
VNQLPSVLVVDDDSFMRELLQRCFTNAGMPVRTFASASELLATADLSLPCVLLLDVRMPGMSGPDLQLLLRERGIHVPIIFLTGSSDIPIAVAAMRNGAVDFIEKPFENARLVERVRQTLARYDEPPADASKPGYAHRLASLTPREAEVLESMVTGRTSKQIARDLGGSFRTIETHRTRVMSKMAAASLADLVRQSIEARKPV